MDVFTTYWQCLTRIFGWDDAGIFGGSGGMEKVVIVAISLILLIFLSMDRNHVTYLFTWNILKLFWVIAVENAFMSEDGTTNYHIGLKRRHIVRIRPTYKTRNRICVTDVRKVRNGKVHTAYNCLRNGWRKVCARASHISRYASHC